MARIFNIYFSYKNTMHNAMVSVRKTPFFTEYTLKLEDELLEHVPGNKIISTSPAHFTFQHASSQDSNPLMKELIRAVSQHLHTSEV